MRELSAALEYKTLFNPKSKLDTALYSLYKETFDWCESTARKNEDGSYKRYDAGRLQEVTNYLVKTFSPKMNKVLLDVCNINCKTVITMDYGEVFAAMELEVDKTGEQKLIKALIRASGLTDHAANDIPSLFKKLSDDIDLNSVTFGPEAYKHVKTKLYLSPTFFISKEAFTSEYYFDETDLTSVTEHEIGHMFTLVKFLGAMYYRNIDITDSIKQMESKLKPGDAPKIAKTMIIEMEQTKTTFTDKLIEILKIVFIIPEVLFAGASAIVVAMFMKILWTIISTYFISRLFFIWMTIMWSVFSVLKISGSPTRFDGKNSDTVIGQRNYSLTERAADAFVVSHGRGGDLAQALFKIHNFYRGRPTKNIKTLWVFNAVMDLMNFIYTSIMPNLTIPYTGPYDDEVRRMKMIVENSIAELKVNDLSGDDKKDLIDNIDRAKGYMKQLENKSWFKNNDFVWGLIIRLYKPTTLAGAIKDGNLNADYDRLQEITGSVIRNDLYLSAAKLDVLKK